VTAIIKQLYNESLNEFTVERVAARAGVSEPTVYRYFPNREAMFDAITELGVEKYGAPEIPSHSSGLAAHAVRKFAFFSGNAALMWASFETGSWQTYRKHRHKARAQEIRGALSDVSEHLEPEEIRRAQEIIDYLDSSMAWKMLTEAGLENEEASKAVAWAIDTLVAELARMNERAKKPEEK
jgi:AcrR family transcriptional regulator